MASVADNSTALQVMKDANNDFMAFLISLRDFLSSKGVVTFDIGDGVTVNSLLTLIDDYRNGRFTEVVLGGMDTNTQVKLSTDAEGNLVVTDSKGALVKVSCDKIVASTIENCYSNNVTVKGAHIESVSGKISVTGGNITLSGLNVDNLNVTGILDAGNMRVANLDVEQSVSCSGVTLMGSRKFVPASSRSVFERDGLPINNAASILVIENNTWDMDTDGNLTPEDLGFGVEQGNIEIPHVPDLVNILGDNAYTDFSRSSSFNIRVPIGTTTNVGTIVESLSGNVYHQRPLEGTYALASVMLWPTGFRSVTIDDTGILYLTGFLKSDVGKDVYYRVGSNPWAIYRVMKVVYPVNSEESAKVYFDCLTELPAYSCTRFIVGRKQSNRSGEIEIAYTLEFA